MTGIKKLDRPLWVAQSHLRQSLWTLGVRKNPDREEGTSYRREHINRLGDYLPDLQRSVPPLDPTIDFAFKSAA